MNSRSKKYFENFKIKNVTEAVAKNSKATKVKGQDNPSKQNTSENQDDTGGGNDSGKRSDEN